MPGELDQLQGTWYIASIEADGQKMPGAGDAKIVIKGRAFTSLGMGAAYEGTVEVDETSRPKSFQLLFTVGHAAGTKNRGIYKLRDGTWTMCLATRGGRRPADFATRPGTGFVLQTLERKKPRRRASTGTSSGTAPRAQPMSAAAVVSDPPSGAPTSWEGEWAMVGAVFNGAAMAQDMVKWCRRITRGDVTTVVAGPQVMLKARFSLDGWSTPNGVDYVNLDGAHKGKPQQGIFELAGDVLRVCMAAPGKTRPAEFSSRAGDGRSYTRWRILRDGESPDSKGKR